jgi:hypothetical protein
MSKKKYHKIEDGIELKHCNSCGEWLALSEYHTDNKTWDKLQHTCKSCKSRYKIEYRRRNLESLLFKEHQYRQENRDRINEFAANYRKRNPESVRASRIKNKVKRKYQIMTTENDFTAADIEKLMELQHGMCAACGAQLSEGYEVEHSIPLTRGGDNSPDNILLMCSKHNNNKKNKKPSEYIDYLSRLDLLSMSIYASTLYDVGQKEFICQ